MKDIFPGTIFPRDHGNSMVHHSENSMEGGRRNSMVVNGISLGIFEWYLFRFNSNGSSISYQWEYSNGTYINFYLSFMGFQSHITKNILVVQISIQY